MFLQKLIDKNPALIKQAVRLHQQGLIPANSYLLDLDMLYYNAKQIKEEADRYGLKAFAMTKQIGRNPAAMRTLQAAGIDACVCVDMADARRVHEAGLVVGHLGHLVQVPFAEVKAAVAMQPLYWTVYSLEKAKEISDALPEGQIQNILLRIFAPGDTFYTGHEGGFAAETVVETAKAIDAMRGLHFSGISTFPTQLFDATDCTVEHTHNYETLRTAAAQLHAAGFEQIELNAPGTTSLHLFAEMAAAGVTQVEPGHGLTGTTPIHALKEMVEQPAMVYVSEVSHLYQNRGYCYGGGMYIDPVFEPYTVKACVGKDGETALAHQVACDIPSPAAIDYYGILEQDAAVQPRDTVVFGFRAQVFVTRAFVVPVSGIQSGTPKVEGIFDSDGKKSGWPTC